VSRSFLGALLAALLVAPHALAEDTPAPPPVDAAPQATALWAVLQLIPSSEVVIWDGVVHYGARWQVTPLLYSVGVNRKLSPWRAFVAEPSLRHSGSIELHVSPEVLSGHFAHDLDRWLLRVGLRSYIPIFSKGETLSASVGGSLLLAGGRPGAFFEAGVHTFGGMLGLRVGRSHSPGVDVGTIGVEVRIF
jgi:hypothetical protein